MGKVIVRRDTPNGSLARLELSNGDQVVISVGEGEVKVAKMRWAGMLPGPTLWQSASASEIGEKFSDEAKLPLRPIEAVIDKVIDCRSAEEVAARLSVRPDHVLSQYAAVLEKTGDRAVTDISELPYPKAMIKSALRHYLRRVSRADQKAVNALEVAYVSLAHFQALTEEEEDVVAMTENVHHAPGEKIDGGDVYSAVLSRCRAEGAELFDELRSLSQRVESGNAPT
jgi:hypothetical protein